MRLTIARKIALAVIAIVILCVGTMAWVTSANLQRGFVAYLNEMQGQDLDQFAGLLAARYHEEGDFEWLRRRPRMLGELVEQMRMQLQVEGNGPRGPRREPRDGRGFDGPPRGERPGPPPRPPQPARDPKGFAARISIVDADGRPVIGPPDPPPGMERAIVVDGRTVGTVRLAPLRQVGNAGGSAGGFLRNQLRDILWLAGALIVAAVLLAGGLARHLLRPVVALRGVTERLARGQLEARAPVLGRDELAELAQHVNAMAQELEQNERRRRKVLADVSHELRTPLTVIRGEIEALLDGVRQASPAALESLHAEVLRLNQLVDDLHQLALADAGDLHYQRQAVELGALLAPLVERYRARAAALDLALEWHAPTAPLTVHADAGRLTQVVLNLLENSLRYTDPGGRVVLALRLVNGQAELSVDDSAPGVPEGAHARLFERLYRVDQARTRERGGSGLGLSICQVMVEAHGGSIAAQPSTLGGIRMQIRLPLASHD